MRAATVSGVSISGEPRLSAPSITVLPGGIFRIARVRFGYAASIAICWAAEAVSFGRKEYLVGFSVTVAASPKQRCTTVVPPMSSRARSIAGTAWRRLVGEGLHPGPVKLDHVRPRGLQRRALGVQRGGEVHRALGTVGVDLALRLARHGEWGGAGDLHRTVRVARAKATSRSATEWPRLPCRTRSPAARGWRGWYGRSPRLGCLGQPPRGRGRSNVRSFRA